MSRSPSKRRIVAFTATSCAAIGAFAWNAFSSPPAGLPAGPVAPQGVDGKVLAWNDLGMHCIDPDFSLFSILPPYNNVNAQVIVNGDLLDLGGGYTVTFEAVADANGSINTTSIGKTNFWDYEDDLFGVQLPPDSGLAGVSMPGAANTPQDLTFSSVWNWFQAEGIPMTPIDDAGVHNKYPLVKIVVRDSAGVSIAETVTSVPNSAELNCAACHGSGMHPDARPTGGWAHDPSSLRDDRLNILRLHDERHANDLQFQAALATAGYDPAGLLATANAGTSVLCSRCHGSNALPGTGIAGISKLTVAMHDYHSHVTTPAGETMDSVPSRVSCYTCHPGAETKCLRGAMGSAIGPDGQAAMDCQKCHGTMSDVGDPTRVGWLEQPNCQACHTGDAVTNSGQIRYTNAFDASGALRTPASTRFATQPNTPAAGFSLYRFSEGHGGLECSACHGSTHAIYPTTEDNDNAQSMAFQGHVGTIMECSGCHTSLTQNQMDDGPHGMHPTTAAWVNNVHGDLAEHNLAACAVCHGTNYRGTVLSRAGGDRNYQTQFGAKNFWRGYEVGCYACHDGPHDDDNNNNHAPVVANLTRATPNDTPLPIPLSATDQDGGQLTLRIVKQPRAGTVAFDGATATFLPEPGQTGAAEFTYAASDNESWSNLATVHVDLNPPACGGTIEPFGFGCAGAGTETPRLEAQGCPEPGSSLTLNVTGGAPGANALLVMGSGFGTQREFGPGCVLRVQPVLLISPVLIDGAGNASVQVPITAAMSGQLRTFQVVVRAPGNGYIGAFTNGLEVHIP
ncbi:MAG: Ig-like domain-containing protein [Planctomycetota bacterium]